MAKDRCIDCAGKKKTQDDNNRKSLQIRKQDFIKFRKETF